ncbi:MAG: methionine--tRNA ligase subunit beta, partial [Acidobacteriota bacterium]|nr:methionine--tRNA ligase subunit beta [Acidobacteriota bacterium]
LYPFMPESSLAIARQLGLEEELGQTDPTQLSWGGLKQGTRIGEVAPLFPRIDKAKIMAEIGKELAEKEESERRGQAQGVQAGETQSGQTQAAHSGDRGSGAQPSGAHATQAAVPGAPTADVKPAPPTQGATEAQAQPEGLASFITIDDFARVEMRVGEVLTAERVPKSDKLLRFTIDLGEPQPRQILAGIAEYYEPEKLVGRKVVVVSNLKPRKLRGFESQGMVLAASFGEEGRPVLATFTEDVPNGARLK